MRVAACSQIGCEKDGRKCLPLLWVCLKILKAGYDIDFATGRLRCLCCRGVDMHYNCSWAIAKLGGCYGKSK